MRVKQSTISACAFAAYAVMSLLLASGVLFIQRTLGAERSALAQQAELKELSRDLDESSDRLTQSCRRYIVTGDARHLRDYWAEVEVTRRREHILERLERAGAPKDEYTLLERAKRQSDAIMPVEVRAMRLVHEVRGIAPGDMPPQIGNQPLSAEDVALSPEAKMATARGILFDVDSEGDKGHIKGLLSEFERRVDARTSFEVASARARTGSAFTFLTTLPFLIPIGMGFILATFQLLMGVPIARYIRTIQGHGDRDGAPSLPSQGTQELRTLADALNRQFEINEDQRRALESLATTDALTGLNNRRAFQEGLDKEYAAAIRSGRGLSLAMIDIDDFKGFNDAFGHPQGDLVLRQVAEALRTSARGIDLVARYGGEEFVILLPDTDVKGAREAAERFRRAIKAWPWPIRPITASVGVASLGKSIVDPQALLSGADEALYLSKAGGRDRVTHIGGLAEAA